MYTSLDDNDDGYFDNYISRGLCGTGPVNPQDFTIQATKIPKINPTSSNNNNNHHTVSLGRIPWN